MVTEAITMQIGREIGVREIKPKPQRKQKPKNIPAPNWPVRKKEDVPV